MIRRLPPLQTLRAFEAAARHLNFTRAAEELKLTHGAVSHQIAALEARLGRKLFRRAGRGVVLDPAGAVLAARLREQFEAIAQALDQARAPRAPADALTLSVLPSFAAQWLLPRLPRFVERHPGIALNLQTTVALANFEDDGVMLALRYGEGAWPGVVATRLLDETLFPVAAPSLARGALARDPRALAHAPLIDDANHPWSLWLVPAGLATLPVRIAQRYNDSALVLEAAARGLGVALGRGTLVERALAEGRLVKLYRMSAPSARAYYVVHPPALADDPRVAAFKTWLATELAADRAAARPAASARRSQRRVVRR